MPSYVLLRQTKNTVLIKPPKFAAKRQNKQQTMMYELLEALIAYAHSLGMTDHDIATGAGCRTSAVANITTGTASLNTFLLTYDYLVRTFSSRANTRRWLARATANILRFSREDL